MLKSHEIQQKETELANLEKRLAALQTPIVEPQADSFDDVDELLKARRHWQQSERDRLEQIAAIEVILPKLRSQFAIQSQGFAELEAKVNAGFNRLSDAALNVNQILNQAHEAIVKFEALALQQAELGHAIVYGSEPYQKYGGVEFPIFAITSTKITLWNRQKFEDYQRGGNISQEVRT